MICTFRFQPKFVEGRFVLGEIPAGRVIKSEPVFNDGPIHWLIEVDTEAEDAPPIDIYAPQT